MATRPSRPSLMRRLTPPCLLKSKPTTTAPPPVSKPKVAPVNTKVVAGQARNKLHREISQKDHNLRLLVGHINLLDGLTTKMADIAIEEQNEFDSFNEKFDADAQHIERVDLIIGEKDQAREDVAVSVAEVEDD